MDAGLSHQYSLQQIPQPYQHYLASPRMHHFPRNTSSTQVVSTKVCVCVCVRERQVGVKEHDYLIMGKMSERPRGVFYQQTLSKSSFTEIQVYNRLLIEQSNVQQWQENKLRGAHPLLGDTRWDYRSLLFLSCLLC